MTCKDFEILTADCLAGQLSTEDDKILKLHLAECDSCRQAFAEMQKLWQQIISMPEDKPTPSLHTKFYTMLAEEKVMKQRQSSIRQKLNVWLNHWWPKEPAVQLAFVFGMLLFAFGSRLQMSFSLKKEFTNLKSEVQNMRQTVSLSLLEQSSAVERLQGVQLAYQLDKPSKSLFEKLLEHINQDPNMNVRLAAVDALYLFSGEQDVFDQIVSSLSKQRSPLVQIALIDLLTDIRQQQAIQTLKVLIQDQKLSRNVQEHARYRITEMM